MEYTPLLLTNQRKNIKTVGKFSKLTFKEVKRFDLLIDDDIFIDNDKCVVSKKKMFQYRGNKASLYKILYHNYIDDLDTYPYIKINYKFRNCKKWCVKIPHIKKNCLLINGQKKNG